MILRILLLTCAVLLPATTALTVAELNKYYKSCFKDANGAFRLHGQETPLSSTMDNFIALAEKFEAANNMMDLKFQLQYFITHYLVENIQFTGSSIVGVALGNVKLEKIMKMWQYDDYKPEVIDPFTPEERCNLYFLISHSILSEDTRKLRSYTNTNDSIYPPPDLNAEDYYPQEVGVVEVRGSDGPVSLGKVLVGLYVGLNPQRKVQLRSLIQESLIQDEDVPQEDMDSDVDTLYATTMADVLMLSNFTGLTRKGIAKNAEWVSVPLPNTISGMGEGMEDFCPMVYKHPDVISDKDLPLYSYASLRGAADGLILGLTIPKIYNSDSRLSLILRTYYSPRGIIVNEPIEDIPNRQRVSSCNRNSVINDLEPIIIQRMKPYGYLVTEITEDVPKSYEKAQNVYNDIKNEVFKNGNGNGYCNQATSLENPEELTAETFLDILVVMDTSNTEKNFLDQQLITGYLSKQLDLRYDGSRMTVLLDHRISSQSGASSRIELKPAVSDTYSTSCAACTVAQLNYEKSSVPREDVIIAVDQLLQERKSNESALNGANGKVVIYFNYDNGDGRTTNNRVQDKVEKALRDFNLRHPDVVLYAVGLDVEILKKYAKDDPALVFLGSDDKPKQVADKIFKKIVFAPTLLQYSGCQDGRNEKSSTYETFVSPSKIQHYTMPAKYFYKSFDIKFLFESQDGQIRVCYNRATMKPESVGKYCKESSQGTPAEFTVSNPCKSFTKDTCSPMYFAVMGKDPAAETNGNKGVQKQRSCKTNDRTCSTLDQIKFKVSHEGIRCSGCLGLTAPPVVILLTMLLSYFLHRKF